MNGASSTLQAPKGHERGAGGDLSAGFGESVAGHWLSASTRDARAPPTGSLPGGARRPPRRSCSAVMTTRPGAGNCLSARALVFAGSCRVK